MNTFCDHTLAKDKIRTIRSLSVHRLPAPPLEQGCRSGLQPTTTKTQLQESVHRSDAELEQRRTMPSRVTSEDHHRHTLAFRTHQCRPPSLTGTSHAKTTKKHADRFQEHTWNDRDVSMWEECGCAGLFNKQQNHETTVVPHSQRDVWE